MPTRVDADTALKVIALRVPSLSAKAVRMIKATQDKYAIKGAAALCLQALAHDGLTAKERDLLTKVASEVEDESRAKIFRIRMSADEYEALETAAEAEGFKDMSKYARWKLFGLRD